MEEKIPVFDEDHHQSQQQGGGGPGKEEETKLIMSATSYPGQEWNPYGDGGFEEWE